MRPPNRLSVLSKAAHKAFECDNPPACFLSMTAMGHEERFPPPTFSGSCRFGRQTFAKVQGNGKDAPIPISGRHSNITRYFCGGDLDRKSLTVRAAHRAGIGPRLSTMALV